MRPNAEPQAANPGFDAILDQAHEAIGSYGMDALIYDFAPVPFTPEGEIITPSIFCARNMPSNMGTLWCAEGLYQHDPVQKRVLRSIRPIYWSYYQNEQSTIVDDSWGMVADYLRDCHLARGISVPIHTPGRGSATVTGIWRSPPPRKVVEGNLLAEFMFFAANVHNDLIETINGDELLTTAVRLTPRERECILLCADGLSDKQVAHALGRSISTIVMHLQSAMRKLGARNRAQAVARAAHYGLLR